MVMLCETSRELTTDLISVNTRYSARLMHDYSSLIIYLQTQDGFNKGYNDRETSG